MAGKRNVGSDVRIRVLSLITEAMDLLDANGISPEAAAYLAMAKQELHQLPRG